MTKDKIIDLLKGKDDQWLYQKAAQVKSINVGEKVYLRGLIEASNICSKDCLYCGIRASNQAVDRYLLSPKQILQGAQYALENNYGSVVIQTGEQRNEAFIAMIEQVVKEIKSLSQGRLGITLSLGEQSQETYRRWYEAGAHRYLLRIESSDPKLFERIHPKCDTWQERYNALLALKKYGYQVGSGVMIGLPFQKIEDLANDLEFMTHLDIDMCGMGPYIEHSQAPLSKVKSLYSTAQRIELTLRMIALLRILMPKINIAATTALHTLDSQGREKGIASGANILMPNVTSQLQREKYTLYTGKVTSDVDLRSFDIGWGEWGDSKHFKNRNER
ncbi:MAG: [FeFe] hydrogenase H-cluster radical SAM maturase HydE [Rikenellaceae bacterium]